MKDLENHHGGPLSLKPFLILELLLNQFNNTSQENSNEPEQNFSSKYFDIEEMHNIEIPLKSKLLSLFQRSTCSLDKNYDDLKYILR